jgi:hypothetical protein
MIREGSLYYGKNQKHQFFDRGYDIFNEKIQPDLSNIKTIEKHLKLGKEILVNKTSFKIDADKHFGIFGTLKSLKDNLMSFIT